jgi:hypothetical protein
MTLRRWTFETLDGVSTYTFSFNPNAATSPHAKDSLEWFCQTDGTFVGLRTLAKPVDWSFSGVLRDQIQYNELVDWVTAHRTRVRLITDLPETLIVRLNGFSPDRTGPQRTNVPWRHTYTMKALVFSYEPGVSRTVSGPLGSTTLRAFAGSTGAATVAGPTTLVTVSALNGNVSTP